MPLTGKVRKWKEEGGYGFVKVDSRNQDLFVHVSDLHEEKSLSPGDTIEFDIGHGQKGPKAINVRLLK